MSSSIENHLSEVVRGLIINHDVTEFWLCEQGTFDCLSRLVMKELKKEFENITLCLILRRNEYIAKNADYIVCYINRKSGGAYRAVEIARKYDKKVINLAEYI